MATHDLGRLFFTTFTYPPSDPDQPRRLPLVERSQSGEVEPPYRWGPGLAFRLPFTRKAVVIGWWTYTSWDEDQSLLRALSIYKEPHWYEMGADDFAAVHAQDDD